MAVGYSRGINPGSGLRKQPETTTTPAQTVADSSLLRSSVSDILGLKATATKNDADAEASRISALGYDDEAKAYDKASAISDDNARVAGFAGEIEALQAARGVVKTVGAQKAAVASAGFGASGSSLDLLRDSVQQGYLSDQLIRSQTALTQGGYLEEAAASAASGTAARRAGASSQALSEKEAAAGALATANAASQTSALQAYITSTQGGAPLTAAQTLSLSALNADPAVAGSFSNEALGLTGTTATTASRGGDVESNAFTESQAAQQAQVLSSAPMTIGQAGGALTESFVTMKRT